MCRRSLLFVFLLFGALCMQAQDKGIDSTLVQFSGMILDGSDDNLYPIPFANILIKDEARGTYSDFNGFFSIVAERGSRITFSAIGYKDIDFMIPDTLKDDRYSVVQLMSQDTINLPETVVFPWPNRDHFKLEFLAMYYYLGQTPPMNIFNPIAWKQFFDAWKNGWWRKHQDGPKKSKLLQSNGSVREKREI